MRRARGIAAGAVLAATGLLTAGCLQGGAAATGAGSSATTDTASNSATPSGTATPADEQAVAAAFGKTVVAGSARIATVTAVGLGNLSAPLTASGTISFVTASTDLTEHLPGGNGSAETRFVNGVLYEKLPASMVSQLSKGKPWISLQVARMNQQGDGSLRQLLNDAPADPSTVLGFLRGADTNVTNLGQDTVNGSPTTHYRLMLNLDKAAQGQNQVTQQGITALEHELGSNQLPADVWLDQAGRLLKISTKETLTGTPAGSASQTATPQQSGAISFSFTATFSDFGVPAKISAPPADQVTDLTKTLGG